MLKDELVKLMEENPFMRLNDAVYQVLYEAVVEQRLQPQSLLSETALAKSLEVSRTPVRSAFLRLSEEGLLCRPNAQSFRVAGFTRSECQELMEARIPLESQAAYWAAERIKPEQMAELEKELKRFAQAFENWQVKEMVLADSAFHQLIMEAATNSFMFTLYEQLAPRVVHYRYYLYNRTPRLQLAPLMGASLRIHRALYNALKLGFATEARVCMERDISGMTNIVGLWNE